MQGVNLMTRYNKWCDEITINKSIGHQSLEMVSLTTWLLFVEQTSCPVRTWLLSLTLSLPRGACWKLWTNHWSQKARMHRCQHWFTTHKIPDYLCSHYAPVYTNISLFSFFQYKKNYCSGTHLLFPREPLSTLPTAVNLILPMKMKGTVLICCCE